MSDMTVPPAMAQSLRTKRCAGDLRNVTSYAGSKVDAIRPENEALPTGDRDRLWIS
jgi:hypothetical protein